MIITEIIWKWIGLIISLNHFLITESCANGVDLQIDGRWQG